LEAKVTTKILKYLHKEQNFLILALNLTFNALDAFFDAYYIKKVRLWLNLGAGKP
jgi:hypothetical protein